MADPFDYHERNASLWGWVAGSIGVVVIVLMLVLPFILQKGQLDEYGCPETGSTYKTVILLDNSDPLSVNQHANLDVFLGCLMGVIPEGVNVSNQLCANEQAIAKHERLVAYQLPEQGERPELLESSCSPGHFDSRKVSEKLSEGRHYAHAKWERFKLHIYGSFERSRASSGAQITPLIEALQYIASREFAPPNIARRLAAQNKLEGRLIVISDFIQNSSTLNQFKELGSLEEIVRDYPFSLAAATIEMRYLKRPAYSRYQTLEHQSWWAELLNHKGHGTLKAEVW